MNQLIRVCHTVLKPNKFIVNLALDEDASCQLCCFFHGNSAFGCLQFLLRELQEPQQGSSRDLPVL